MASYASTLAEHLVWLEGRCRREARKLPGVGDGELLGAVWLRCIDRAEQGWFDQRPTVSLEAQVKHLMNQCLRHEVTAIRRYWKKHGELPAPSQERSSGEEPLERIAAEPQDLEAAIFRDEQLAAVKEAVEHSTTPVRGLCLLSRDVPWVVLLRHVELAKSFRRGGSRMPLRAAEEAYSMLEQQRQHVEITSDPIRWKPVLGGIYYDDQPLSAIPQETLEHHGKTVERQANRGLEDLQRAMAGWGDTR